VRLNYGGDRDNKIKDEEKISFDRDNKIKDEEKISFSLLKIKGSIPNPNWLYIYIYIYIYRGRAPRED
jgi:hypothetical protein